MRLYKSVKERVDLSDREKVYPTSTCEAEAGANISDTGTSASSMRVSIFVVTFLQGRVIIMNTNGTIVHSFVIIWW